MVCPLNTPLTLPTLRHTWSHAQDLLSLQLSIPSAWNSILTNTVPSVNCLILFLELGILRITVLFLELIVSVSIPYKAVFSLFATRDVPPRELALGG